MSVEFASFDVIARQVLAREIACWSGLAFDDLTALIGMRAHSVIDEAHDLTLRVAVRWTDDRADSIEVLVAVEAPLEHSYCRLAQSIRVLRPAHPEPSSGA